MDGAARVAEENRGQSAISYARHRDELAAGWRLDGNLSADRKTVAELGRSAKPVRLELPGATSLAA